MKKNWIFVIVAYAGAGVYFKHPLCTFSLKKGYFHNNLFVQLEKSEMVNAESTISGEVAHT